MTHHLPGAKKPHIVKRGAAHYECYYRGKDRRGMFTIFVCHASTPKWAYEGLVEYLLEEGVRAPTPR